MQNFHLNAVYADWSALDPEGSPFADLAAARTEAFASLCTLAVQDFAQGRRIGIRQIASREGDLDTVTLADVLLVTVPFDDDSFFSTVVAKLMSTR
ncbi:hypothetical protein [Rhizobium wenxiniae]|uniref:Capsid protein n=1 Tax=Rhizobium wenxiniae TaxID=1737357 RepID=A0A7W9YBK5_9HYPH|nr:hypothetical protein [Rhizobium wenxiniae]MBB6165602.1 capsid protein [Rhizobium wenxiniae]GGG17303.1 hypothetical protein GCM10010924_52980 [Rhizobium wenxiniae]